MSTSEEVEEDEGMRGGGSDERLWSGRKTQKKMEKEKEQAKIKATVFLPSAERI